jgi:hypothetical protein
MTPAAAQRSLVERTTRISLPLNPGYGRRSSTPTLWFTNRSE